MGWHWAVFGFSAAGCAKVSIIYTVGIPLGGREKNTVQKRSQKTKAFKKTQKKEAARECAAHERRRGCVRLHSQVVTKRMFHRATANPPITTRLAQTCTTRAEMSLHEVKDPG